MKDEECYSQMASCRIVIATPYAAEKRIPRKYKTRILTGTTMAEYEAKANRRRDAFDRANRARIFQDIDHGVS